MTTFTERYVSLLAIIFVLGSCSAQKQSQQAERMALGEVGRSVIESPQYPWFDTTYGSYRPTADMLEDMNTQLDSVRFVVVFGTWCSDSRREVPRFFKLMDLLGFPQDRITLYGVDRSLHSPPGIPQQFTITKVPTIIVLRNGAEAGRIVEAPKTTLEFDLMEILVTVRH